MGNPDRIRERMEEQKDTEQTFWVWSQLELRRTRLTRINRELSRLGGIQMIALT